MPTELVGLAIVLVLALLVLRTVVHIVPELKALEPELVTTNLPADKEARLRELFAETQPVR